MKRRFLCGSGSMRQADHVGLKVEGDDLVAHASSGPPVRISFRDLKRILAIRFGETFMSFQYGWVIFEADPISIACDAQKCPGAAAVIFRDWRERIDAAGILHQADGAHRPPQFRRRGFFSSAPKLLLMTRGELATLLSTADIVESETQPKVFDLNLAP
jgi:hypothetical protein